MSELRLAKGTDLEAFPGCQSIVIDSPPIAQCQEAQINELNAAVLNGFPDVTKVGIFAGIDLAGKKATIDATVADNGTYNVLSNTDDVVTTDHNFQADDPSTEITVHDDGVAYLTRDEPSFIRFAENLGNAHTTKGGQLYTDVATGPLAAACSDTYAPK